MLQDSFGHLKLAEEGEDWAAGQPVLAGRSAGNPLRMASVQTSSERLSLVQYVPTISRINFRKFPIELPCQLPVAQGHH